ncbi:MAG: hypothetical protein IPJ41_04005 [Phycisphaerales bacterium]|nr:hypothetical protein [Phycisphaerales bacterium]
MHSPMGSRTTWLWLFVASLGAMALLGVLALLTPGVPHEEELLATSAILTAYSLLGLVATFAIAKGPLPAVSWAAVGLLALSLCAWLTLVWFDNAMGWWIRELIAKLSTTATVLGVLGLHAVLLLLVRVARRLSVAVRTGTIAAACLGALLALGMMWEISPLLDDSLTGRVAAALLIPAALGTIAVPVLARIDVVARRDSQEDSLDRFVPVTIRCPRCDLERTSPANRKSTCQGCGLEATITLTEPRCACGYLLYGLPSPLCPECGRTVPEARRWGAGAPPIHPPAPQTPSAHQEE